MPFEKGHKKIPGSGRKRGTPNKSRMYIDICEKLESEGYDLVGEAVKLLRKRTTPLEYRVRLMLGIMAHTHPKRIAIAAKSRVEHTVSREAMIQLMSNPAVAKAMEQAVFASSDAPRALPAPAQGSGLSVIDAEPV